MFIKLGRELTMDSDIEQMMNTLDALLLKCDNGVVYTKEELMNTGIFESEEEIDVFFIPIGEYYATDVGVYNMGGFFGWFFEEQ